MANERETVLVTGAAGTVGGCVVRELFGRGYRVIGADRPGARWDLDFPPGAAFEKREGDLTDLGFCLDVVAGAGSVIHTAATIDLGQPWEEIEKINVDAVRYLYEAARARGCRRFVHFSSGSIYDKSQGGAIDEARPFAPQSPYERSKVEAERYLWARPRAGPEVVVLRPTMIYGPRARFLGAKLATLVPIAALFFKRIPRIEGGASCNWAHAEDVARAAVLLLEHPKAAWEAFNVADDEPLTFGEVLEVATRAYGLPLGRTVPYPSRFLRIFGPYLAESDLVLRAASLAQERAWRAVVARYGLVRAISASVDRETFLYATVEAIFDTKKIRALGFEPKWRSFREGYPEVLRWFQKNRWVPTYGPEDRREWMGSVGFEFKETMAGTWRPAQDGGERPFRFTVRARAESSRRFARDGLLDLEGRIEAGGLASGRPCRGTLDISWRKKRELAYDLDFEGDDGRAYRFSGKKLVSLLRPIETMTTLPGRLTDAVTGAEIGSALARFDLRRDLLSLVGSLDLFVMTEARRAREVPVAAAK
jgi:nucleoside-diphosphate-sugar epimerase